MLFLPGLELNAVCWGPQLMKKIKDGKGSSSHPSTRCGQIAHWGRSWQFYKIACGRLSGTPLTCKSTCWLRWEIFTDAIGVGTGKTSPALWRREPWRPYAVGASPSHQRRQAEGERLMLKCPQIGWLACKQAKSWGKLCQLLYESSQEIIQALLHVR